MASPAGSQLLAGTPPCVLSLVHSRRGGGVPLRSALLPPPARSRLSAGASCAALTPVGGCLVVGQYLILANGARGRAGVALIQQAISNPQLFHFGELIDHENIAALDGALATPVPAAHVDALARTCSMRALRSRQVCQFSTSLCNLLLENCLLCAIAV